MTNFSPKSVAIHSSLFIINIININQGQVQKSIKSNEHVNITIQIIKVTFPKMKTKVTLVKAYIIIHQQDTWKYIFKSNIDNNSKAQVVYR